MANNCLWCGKELEGKKTCSGSHRTMSSRARRAGASKLFQVFGLNKNDADDMISAFDIDVIEKGLNKLHFFWQATANQRGWEKRG